jgi:Na+/H+ antiporter NhaD/arsenite permease-like protein
MSAALIIFVATYTVIGLGRVPGLGIDRPSACLIGALAMVFSGVVPLESAYRAVDLPTLALLLGLMLLAANLARAGFFGWVADAILHRTRSAHGLLAAVIVASGGLSALFLNDAVCILFTPLVLIVARRAGRPPLPFLLGVATASNAGGACTISGNPQNALIGTMSKIGYAEFAVRLLPASIVGLVLAFIVISFVYRKELAADPFPSTAAVPIEDAPSTLEAPLDKKRIAITLLAAVGMLVAFVAKVDTALAALSAASGVIVLTGDGTTRDPFRGVDWPLLVTFSGLFVVTAGVRDSGVANKLLDAIRPALEAAPTTRILSVTGITVILSNMVSNVPAVMLLGPILKTHGTTTGVWLTLAMASTLAGNLTLIGSLANLIVAELAKRECPISFVEYLKVGVPLTILSIATGIVSLVLQGIA